MSDARISDRDFAISIGLMLSAAVALSLVTLFAKELTDLAGLHAAIFLRFFLPFLVLVWIAATVLDEKLVFGNWRIHGWRALCSLGAQYCLFYYLSQGSLLFGTLLFSTSGLFLPFLTRLCYGTEIKPRTLAATLISFVGVFIALNPVANFDWVMLVGLASGLLNAGSQAVAHRESKQMSTLAATITMFGFCSVAAFAILAATGGLATLTPLFTESHDARDELFAVVAAFSIVTISNQTLRSKAFRYVNKPSSLSPFYYTAIVFSALLDWSIYGLVPTWHAYLGGALILGGGALMAWRKKPAVAQHEAPAA